jgi:hypothetical protein
MGTARAEGVLHASVPLPEAGFHSDLDTGTEIVPSTGASMENTTLDISRWPREIN